MTFVIDMGCPSCRRLMDPREDREMIIQDRRESPVIRNCPHCRVEVRLVGSRPTLAGNTGYRTTIIEGATYQRFEVAHTMRCMGCRIPIEHKKYGIKLCDNCWRQAYRHMGGF